MIKYILAITFSFVLYSCDDLLVQEPQNQIATENAYTTEDDALRATSAVYSVLRATNWCCQGNIGTNTGGGYNYWIFQNVNTDDAWKGGESGSDQVYAQQIAHYTVSAGNLAVDDAWDILYIGVRRANLVLDNIPDIEMDPSLKERLLAEAKFLRGYFYFLLVQTFGDVPLILETEQETYEVIRTPKADVINQIIADWEDAETILPSRTSMSASDKGRATRGAAQAYLGKLYMFLNDFQNAELKFSEVINSGDYELDSSYENLFTNAGENSAEHIFQIHYHYDPPNTHGNPMGTIMGSRSRNGWGFNLPTQDFVDAFEEGDPRMSYTVYWQGKEMPDGEIADVGNAVGWDGYMNQKAYMRAPEERPGNSLTSRDQPMMRLGKVMLWYAEAANENGNTSAALSALNEIRQRAREGNNAILPNVTETDQGVLRELIWQEQRVEYGQEFERFFDLVRTGRAEEVLRAFSQKTGDPQGANFTSGIHEIFPIPPSEITLSEGLLTQNPGY